MQQLLLDSALISHMGPAKNPNETLSFFALFFFTPTQKDHLLFCAYLSVSFIHEIKHTHAAQTVLVTFKEDRDFSARMAKEKKPEQKRNIACLCDRL